MYRSYRLLYRFISIYFDLLYSSAKCFSLLALKKVYLYLVSVQIKKVNPPVNIANDNNKPIKNSTTY